MEDLSFPSARLFSLTFSYLLNIDSVSVPNLHNKDWGSASESFFFFFFSQHGSNPEDAWNIFRLFWFNGNLHFKKEGTFYSRDPDHESNLTVFYSMLLLSGSDFIFPGKKAIKSCLFFLPNLYFSIQMKTFVFLQRGPLAVPENHQRVCEPRSKCFNMKNWSNILKCICNQKQTPEISPMTC